MQPKQVCKCRSTVLCHRLMWTRKWTPLHTKRCVRAKSPSLSTHIMCLPNEILLVIFRLLRQRDLLCSVGLVCRRWMDLLLYGMRWRKIDINRSVPRNILGQWFSVATMLRHLTITDVETKSVTAILSEVSKHCRELEILEVCKYRNSRSIRINGTVICKLVANCTKLSLIFFKKVELYSYGFFSLLPKTNSAYIGPITYGQLHLLLSSLKHQETPIMLRIHTPAAEINLQLNLRLIDALIQLVGTPNEDSLAVIFWNLPNIAKYDYFNGLTDFDYIILLVIKIKEDVVSVYM